MNDLTTARLDELESLTNESRCRVRVDADDLLALLAAARREMALRERLKKLADKWRETDSQRWPEDCAADLLAALEGSTAESEVGK